jgi:Tol biopolymer transport system component
MQAGDPTWTERGNKIVFVDNACINCPLSNVFTMKLDGTHIRQLTTDGFNWDPRWSPDGQRIVFTREEEPVTFVHEQIYTMGADGSNRVNVTRSAADDWAPSWGPGAQELGQHGQNAQQ